MELIFHHICIETDKYDQSLAFYTQLFGFSIIEEIKDFHGREYNTWLKNKEIIIELQTPKETRIDQNHNSNCLGIMHVCFKVENLDQEVQRFMKINNNIFKDGKQKYQVNGHYISKVIAPEGTIIELRE